MVIFSVHKNRHSAGVARTQISYFRCRDTILLKKFQHLKIIKIWVNFSLFFNFPTAIEGNFRLTVVVRFFFNLEKNEKINDNDFYIHIWVVVRVRLETLMK